MGFARSTALLSSLYRMDGVCSVSAQVMVITLEARQHLLPSSDAYL